MEFTIREEYLKNSPLTEEEIARRLEAARSLVGIISPEPGEPCAEKGDLTGNRRSVREAEAWREELIAGRTVVTPPPPTNHNRVVRNILGLFWNYLMEKDGGTGQVGESFAGEAAFLTEEDHFVPDVTFVRDPDKVESDGIHGAPDLVVEVLSPETVCADRGRKREVCGACGVLEYWTVSPEERTVEVWRSDGSGFASHDVHRLPAGAERTDGARFRCGLFEDLEISLEDIFHRVS